MDDPGTAGSEDGSSSAADGPLAPPWEQQADLGVLTAFFTTVVRVLTRPRTFFEELPSDGPVGTVLLFWALTALPPLMVGGAGTHDFLERLPELINVDPASIPFHFPLWVFVVVLPLLQLGALLSAVLLVHAMLALLGGPKEGWPAACGRPATPRPPPWSVWSPWWAVWSPVSGWVSCSTSPSGRSTGPTTPDWCWPTCCRR